MPTRLDHDRDTGRIVLPQGPSTRRAILQALASALMAAALPGTRAQQKAEKLLMHYEDKPKGEQQCDRRRAVPPPGVRADARLDPGGAGLLLGHPAILVHFTRMYG